MLDLSMEGALIMMETSHIPEVGKEVRLYLKLPGGRRVVDMPCTLTTVKTEGPKLYMGVEFDDLESDRLRWMREFYYSCISPGD